MDDKKLSFDFENICYKLAKLDSEAQNEFFASIENIVTEQEKQALLFGVGYFHLLLNPEIEQVIKSTLAQALFELFNNNA